MKAIKIAFLAGVLLMSKNVVAQSDSTQNANQGGKSPIYWLYDAHYRLAVQYNDYAEAKSALYNLILLEPQNDSLRYNLAYLYYDAGKYPSVVLTCRDLLKLNPNHLGALELIGAAYETLGLKDKALSNYEKLYMSTSDINTLYKMAFLQYDLKKYAESNVNVDILLEKEELENSTVIFPTADKKNKEYPMKVAVLNLKGLVSMQLGNKDEAKKAYEDALAISPDFQQAKANLAELSK